MKSLLLSAVLLAGTVVTNVEAHTVFVTVNWNDNSNHSDYESWMGEKWINIYVQTVEANGNRGVFMSSAKIKDETCTISCVLTQHPNNIYGVYAGVPNQILYSGSNVVVVGVPNAGKASQSHQMSISVGALLYNGSPF